MQFRIKFWVFMLITVLMFVCCFNEKVLYSKTKAYKNQSLNGKHVGAYVPTCEYQIPDSFDIPNGKSFSNIFSSIKIQLN